MRVPIALGGLARPHAVPRMQAAPRDFECPPAADSSRKDQRPEEVVLVETMFPMERSSPPLVGVEMTPLSSVSGMQTPPPEPWEVSEAESEVPQTVANTPWPGPNFKIGHIMAGSVYTWACGESFQGDTMSRASRSQAAAAWVILITQAVAYAGLAYFSGNQPSSENETASETTADYSIVAIAGAMYLILSIAAADVWCGCALIFEGRGSGFVLFTRRRVFGVFLLATFLLLVGASIRVLFYSADEDVQLVLGAAAVLFIADVDEKAMQVLQNINGEWVLFWVLEIVGLSFGLAVFAVKVTRNTDAIDKHDQDHGCTTSTGGGCEIYSWGFVLTLQPTAVTALAFLLTSVISRTTSSVVGRIILPRSWKWLVITLVMFCWVAQTPLWLIHQVASNWFDTFMGGCALAFVIMTCYRRKLTCVNCSTIWREGVRQGGCRLLWCGGLLFSLRLILAYLYRSTSSEEMEVLYPALGDFFSVFEILFAALYMILYIWLINGLRLANLRSAELDSNVELVQFLRPMLLGWCLSEGLFAIHYWIFTYAWKLVYLYPNSYAGVLFAEQLFWLARHVIVGTVLWGEASGTHGVGYWTAATFIRTIVVHCVSTWVYAALDKTVK